MVIIAISINLNKMKRSVCRIVRNVLCGDLNIADRYYMIIIILLGYGYNMLKVAVQVKRLFRKAFSIKTKKNCLFKLEVHRCWERRVTGITMICLYVPRRGRDKRLYTSPVTIVTWENSIVIYLCVCVCMCVCAYYIN